MIGKAFAYFGIAILWALHWLPARWLARGGRFVGLLFHRFGRSRRHVAEVNLRLCFPEMSEAERDRLVRAHFRSVGQTAGELPLLLWGSRRWFLDYVRLENAAIVEGLAGTPVILFAPHFAGLNAGGIRFAADRRTASMYSTQKNPVIDRLIRRGRERFGTAVLFSRQDGVRAIVRALRDGLPLYYLPDMDFGARDAVFVPFFGVPAATIPALARLARLTGAKIVPTVTEQLPGCTGYVVRLHEPWADFPSGDDVADARRMNEFIEARVREHPEQYWWLHKRFKTRPPGEPKVY